MTGEMIVKHPFHKSSVNALRQAFPDELRESPRKRSFGENFTAVKPAAQLPQHAVAMQTTIDQRPGCAQIAHRLGKKCAGQPLRREKEKVPREKNTSDQLFSLARTSATPPLFCGFHYYKIPRMADSLQPRTHSIPAFFRRKPGTRPNFA